MGPIRPNVVDHHHHLKTTRPTASASLAKDSSYNDTLKQFTFSEFTDFRPVDFIPTSVLNMEPSDTSSVRPHAKMSYHRKDQDVLSLQTDPHPRQFEKSSDTQTAQILRQAPQSSVPSWLYLPHMQYQQRIPGQDYLTTASRSRQIFYRTYATQRSQQDTQQSVPSRTHENNTDSIQSLPQDPRPQRNANQGVANGGSMIPHLRRGQTAIRQIQDGRLRSEDNGAMSTQFPLEGPLPQTPPKRPRPAEPSSSSTSSSGGRVNGEEDDDDSTYKPTPKRAKQANRVPRNSTPLRRRGAEPMSHDQAAFLIRTAGAGQQQQQQQQQRYTSRNNTAVPSNITRQQIKQRPAPIYGHTTRTAGAVQQQRCTSRNNTAVPSNITQQQRQQPPAPINGHSLLNSTHPNPFLRLVPANYPCADPYRGTLPPNSCTQDQRCFSGRSDADAMLLVAATPKERSLQHHGGAVRQCANQAAHTHQRTTEGVCCACRVASHQHIRHTRPDLLKKSAMWPLCEPCGDRVWANPNKWIDCACGSGWICHTCKVHFLEVSWARYEAEWEMRRDVGRAGVTCKCGESVEHGVTTVLQCGGCGGVRKGRWGRAEEKRVVGERRGELLGPGWA